MYAEYVSEELLEKFYKQNQIICKNKDGSEFPLKYKLHVDGKFYNFDGEKYGYAMFLKDFTIKCSWLHGPIKQQFIQRWQDFQKEIFPDYENALNEYNQAKAFETSNGNKTYI